MVFGFHIKCAVKQDLPNKKFSIKLLNLTKNKLKHTLIKPKLILLNYNLGNFNFVRHTLLQDKSSGISLKM
jgi:hypothetical protein